MTGHRPSALVFRLVASATLLALGVLPAASVPRASATSQAANGRTVAGTSTPTATESVTLSLTSITPTMAVPRASVTISGTVQNTGSVPIASGVARAFLGESPLVRREAVSEWAAETGQRSLGEVASTPLGPDLAVGGVAAFTLTIPAPAIPHRESFAVLPLRVDVLGTTADGSSQVVDLGRVNTFLPTLSSIKAYEPFAIAWLVPLTLDPDPALHGVDSPARTAAWTKAIGPGSRLDALITGTDSPTVTWAIDPAILGPPRVTGSTATSATQSPATPSTTATPGAAPTPGGQTAADPVTKATAALADRLRNAAPRHTLWSLPYADPDLAALLPLPAGSRALGPLITRTSTLDAAIGSARTDIAWPVAGAVTAVREKQLKAAFASPGLTAAVTSASTLATNSAYTNDASRRSSDGLPLLAYDDALSRTFAQTSSAATGAITIQRFLADSLALLGERPGTPDRSVLVAAPRTFAGDPAVLAAFFSAIADAPWLVATTTDALLAASRAADPEVPGVGTIVRPAPLTAADPLNPGASSLTTARLGAISRTRSAITGVASIRDDAEPFRARWADAQDQILSVRWRGHRPGPTAIDSATQAAIRSVSRGVRVAPSSVNFFADKGVLQITVVNDLPVPVHDVRLVLTPGQPRLRIEQQPGPLRIGAKSRTNVPLQVTAIAAGLVPIEAVLTTPNGTPLGKNARVDVRVQPPSTWIYWVLGAAAGFILVLGTYRSLRRGSTRAARPAAQEIPLDV